MLAWIAENTLVAGCLATGIVGLSRLVRLSPALRHALWLGVFLRLCAPPMGLISLPESMGARAAVGWVQSLRTEHVTASVETSATPSAAAPNQTTEFAPLEAAREPLMAETPTAIEESPALPPAVEISFEPTD